MRFVSSLKSGLAGAVLFGAVGACSGELPFGLGEQKSPQAVIPEETAGLVEQAEIPATMPSIVANFSSVSGWARVDGLPLESGVDSGALAVDAMDGFVFGAPMAAKAGDMFSVSYEVTLPQVEAVPFTYVVGPMFSDIDGNVLRWGLVETSEDGGLVSRTAQQAAPEGTATVRLYAGGLWSADATHAQMTISYSSLRLDLIAPQ